MIVMKNRKLHHVNITGFCLWLIIVTKAATGAKEISLLKPVHLTVNNLESPMIAAGDTPKFGWSYALPGKKFYGLRQTACQILVAGSMEKLEQDEGNYWNSGKMEGERQLNIDYEGISLPPHRKFYWKARVWDEQDKASDWSRIAWFTTGFENGYGWEHAQWITDEQNLSTPGKMRCGCQSPSFEDPSVRVELTIDLGNTERINGIKLWPAAPPVNNAQPGYGFPVRFFIESSESPDFAESIILEDYGEKDLLNPVDQPVSFSFIPASVRYVRLVVTKLSRIPKGNELKWDRKNKEFYFDVNEPAETVLNPGFSVYDAFVPYRGYDVSHMLRSGSNVITVLVGDGWYRKPAWNDRLLLKRRVRGFPSQPARWLIAQLEITGENDNKMVVGTGKDWQTSQKHPWREADLNFGATFDDTFRNPPAEWFHPANTGQQLTFPELIPDERPPVVIRDRIAPVNIWDAGSNRIMVDFGRRITGAVCLTGKVPSETKLKLRYAEALTPEGEPYLRNQAGRAENGDEYVLLHGVNYNLRPLFTYHGFRYMEVTWEGDPSLFDLPFSLELEALAYSNKLRKTAELHTSDKRVNQLTGMIDETFRNNLISLITDVAGRDERAFWLGDCFTTPIQSLCYLYDFAALGRAFFKMMVKSMHEDGVGTVPAPGVINAFVREGDHATPAWSDASVIVPNTLFMHYNDEFSKTVGWKYADVYTSKVLEANESPIPSKIYSTTWIGDWLSNRMTIPPGATSWQPGGDGALQGIYDPYWWNRVLEESARLAKANDAVEEAKHLNDEALKLRDAAISEFPDDNGEVPGNEQSSYALLLSLTQPGTEEEHFILRQLLKAIKDYDYHLATGTTTHLALLNSLSQRGYQDLALKMIMQPAPRHLVTWLISVPPRFGKGLIHAIRGSGLIRKT